MNSMYRRQRQVAVAAALVAVAATASCATQDNQRGNTETSVETFATKSAPNPVRHDLEPLTKRFPALGEPVAASWVSGDMGDPDVPGPSTYWLDSVVELTQETADALKSRYRPVPTNARPDVWTTLTGSLPAGDYLASDDLDGAFASSEVTAKAFLAQDVPVIVITALGQ